MSRDRARQRDGNQRKEERNKEATGKTKVMQGGQTERNTLKEIKEFINLVPRWKQL